LTDNVIPFRKPRFKRADANISVPTLVRSWDRASRDHFLHVLDKLGPADTARVLNMPEDRVSSIAQEIFRLKPTTVPVLTLPVRKQ
jgi:hypothetical protein